MAEESIANRFAVWAGTLEFSDIPMETIHQARRALLDTVGVICAGAKHNVTSAVRGANIEPTRERRRSRSLGWDQT